MKMRRWKKIPRFMRNRKVRIYYDILSKKRGQLIIKRIFDVVAASVLLIILSPIFVVLSICIKLDSKGDVFFRQTRITQYGREFKIFKFRTMVTDAENIGTQVTAKDDVRVTRVGKKIRKLRLDEIPQLINVILGDMTFVGARPEVPKYVNNYSNEMFATLLLPAGITSEASIKFKDEDNLLEGVEDVDKTYINEVLPKKMQFNYCELKNLSIIFDLKVMVLTLVSVIRK